MKRVKEYFKDKTPLQIFSLCLLVTCIIIMLLCAIIRLCGGLWFSADLTLIKEPSIFWQEVIKALLLIFELTFVYKLLCRTKWKWCILISIIEAIIGRLLGLLDSYIISNSFHAICYFVIPIPFVKHWFSLIDSAVLYLLELLYSLLFIVGRIGNIDGYSGFNFIYSVLGIVDYKLFIVSIYLFISNFGGIKLWKNQKRLILQKDLKKKET